MNRWSHISILEIIRDTGVTLKRKGETYVGPHPFRHDSSSGTCLVVWPTEGNWHCTSCKEKGNLVDWLVSAGEISGTETETRAQAIDYLISRYGDSPFEWAPPMPFPDNNGPSFPYDVLPDSMQKFAVEQAEALQVPIDLMGVLSLGVISSIASPRATVKVAKGWYEPLNLYLVPVLSSGEGKTPALNVATRPLEELQAKLLEDSRIVISRAEAEHELLSLQLKNLQKTASQSGADEAIRGQVMEQATLLSEHDVPTSPRLLCEDTTAEALGSLLAENGGVIAMISDEGGIFETMTGKYSKDHLSIDVYLKAYSGTAPLRVDRKGRPPEYVERPKLTMVLCIQPDILQGLSKQPSLNHRGLIPRIAFVIPESLVGYRKDDPFPISDEANQNYRKVINSIAALDTERKDRRNILTLSLGAENLHKAYRRGIELQLRPGGKLYEIKEWGNKLKGFTARLAGVLHMANITDTLNRKPNVICRSEMQKAINLSEYFAGHAIVAYGLLGSSGSLSTAQMLWEQIMRQHHLNFSKRELHQSVKSRYKSSDIEEGLNVLEEWGYIRKIYQEPSEGRGRPPSPRYESNPLALEAGNRKQMNLEHQHPESFVFEDSEIIEHKIVTEKPNAYMGTSPKPDVDNSSENSLAQNSQKPQKYPDVILVDEKSEAERIVGELLREEAIGLDIETTGLDPLLDKIRLVQIATSRDTYVFDINHVPASVLNPLLVGVPIKVIHNAKFDASFLYEAPNGVMPEPIYDTMITDQVLHHRSYPRSLKDVSKEYLGVDLDKEEQTSDWSAEILSEEQLQYAAQDAAVLLPIRKILDEKAAKLQITEVVELENRLVPAICWMERCGVNLDKGLWDKLVKIAEEKALRLKGELNLAVAKHTMSGLDLFGNPAVSVNWDSPAQVKKLLSDLGVQIENTRHATLEASRGKHPVIALLLDYREAAKKVSTYGTDWNKHINKASNRIHPNWVQIGSATGRTSCKNPNLQNIPREAAYRNCFRAVSGNMLIKADYEQIELRIAAEIAADTRMKKAFYEGRDLHSVTASYLLGKPESEPVTDSQRQMAKAVNFGLIFGMGARGLSSYAQNNFRVEMDEEKAATVRRRYFEAYAGIKNWHELQGRKQETRTILGRHRILEGDRDYTNRLNSPIQGSAADGLKLALIKLWETRHKVDAYPVLTVHDEIVIETPKEQVQKATEWLKRCMEDGMGEFLREVPVAVDVTVKESWG